MPINGETALPWQDPSKKDARGLQLKELVTAFPTVLVLFFSLKEVRHGMKIGDWRVEITDLTQGFTPANPSSPNNGEFAIIQSKADLSTQITEHQLTIGRIVNGELRAEPVLDGDPQANAKATAVRLSTVRLVLADITPRLLEFLKKDQPPVQ